MTILSVRKFFAAAVLMACLPLGPHAASAAPAANLPDFTDLVDKVGPAVVNIRTTARVSNSTRGLPPGMDDGDMSEFFRRFFGIPMPNSPQSPGTPNSPNSPNSPRGGNND
jgi:serine protease Do